MAKQTKTLADIQNKKLLKTQGLINGEWTTSASSKATFDVIDPATLEKLATLPEMDKTDVAKSVDAAHEAFKSYKKTSARQRARMLRKWSDLCHENADDLALIMTLENGKTLTESKGEVIYSASFLEWFATQAEVQHGEVVPPANLNQRILTFKQPIGVAACLAPWNFPAAMITRKCGAALAAGCTTVWKPAGETPLTALALAVLAEEAGFPKGSINVITSLQTVAEVGEELCTNPKVHKVSFTGSTRVGKLLMKQCSSTLKKLSLELGGNSPFIVFDDAKMETAVEAAVLAKFRNSGQTCVTANRIFVQAGIYDEFAKRLAERIGSLKVGAGTEDGVFVGPLTHDRAVEKALAHIEDAKKHGGKVVVGGAPAKETGKGYFLQPTLITNMSQEMITTREETFAPVMGLYKFETEEEVIERANDCDVGLGSFIITENQSRSWRVAEELEVGMVGVNVGVLSACESPFGGVKGSGFGREGGTQGINEYLVTKAMLINIASKL
ncbi:Putative aldehyde dehydrogenase domain, aldehyde/histidinol dehydrogenase [Septoria linicola]|uniref:succinate-semialdehyde dehydrogenase [NAD(P)(+)] n=1 Tax=Septoria linicola TaxID=215465 RepID=A0A9Q9AWR6_9PEZI|nr:putative aldehyde dehydrogenase domain, aldehyde/histidinol dehydrogenase [Septoria linicola]USW52076.1 Putative aldehyde dehydrogenase domain, aldehyde/histidinol dehydrogenase [Septoria linicola]